MTKIKSLDEKVLEITGRMQKNVLTEDSIYAALILHNDITNLFRSWALECVGKDDVMDNSNNLKYKKAANRLRRVRNDLRREIRKKIEEATG